MRTRRGRLAVFFASVYLAQGLLGIAYEPLAYQLKDGFGLSAGASAAFLSLASLPLLLKPLWAFLSDAVPLLGRRRLPYLRAATLLACAAWLAASRSASLAPLLAALALANAGLALCDISCDALLVEEGRSSGSTGFFQASQLAPLNAALLLTGLCGGYLAQHWPATRVFLLASLFPLAILASSLGLEEAPAAEGAAARALGNLGAWLRSRAFWAPAALILLYHFTPVQGSALFYHQSVALGFSKMQVGALVSLSGACGALGAVLGAAALGRRLELGGRTLSLDAQNLLRLSLWLAAPAAALFAAYKSFPAAAAITAGASLFGMALRVALLDLLARSCPPSAEASSYALFMSLFSLSASASNAFGGTFYSRRAPAWGSETAVVVLAFLGAAAALACLPLLHRLTPSREPEPSAGVAALEPA